MDRRNFLAGGLAFLAAASQQTLPRLRWTLLGARRVSARSGRIGIQVFRDRNPITELSFRTRGEEVRISDVQVIFTRGTSERIPSFVTARGNIHSLPVRVRSRGREIRRVDFTYRRTRPANRFGTIIEVHGRG